MLEDLKAFQRQASSGRSIQRVSEGAVSFYTGFYILFVVYILVRFSERSHVVAQSHKIGASLQLLRSFWLLGLRVQEP